MTHDQMCPTVNADVPFGLFHDDVPDDCLFCDLIARVRADERERAAEVIYTIYKAAFPMTDYEVGYCAGARASRDAIAAARGGDA